MQEELEEAVLTKKKTDLENAPRTEETGTYQPSAQAQASSSSPVITLSTDDPSESTPEEIAAAKKASEYRIKANMSEEDNKELAA